MTKPSGCVFHKFSVALLLFAMLIGVNAQTTKEAARNPVETLFEITANGQTAWVLRVGKVAGGTKEVYFKGPGHDKIMVMATERNPFPGFIIEFSYINSRATLKHFLAYEFGRQGKIIPAIYSFNGELVTGFGDGASQEAELDAACMKEFKKLPPGFQQALQDFYLFGNESTTGVDLLAVSLGSLIENGLGLKPYPVVDVRIETDQVVIRSIKKEFGLGLGG